MKLLYRVTSPFVRKVLVTAHEIGIADQIELIDCDNTPVNRDEKVSSQNPLGKIPVLITENDGVLIESGLICEYLDGLHDGRALIPVSENERRQVLQWQALIDGLTQAGVAIVYDHLLKPEAYHYQPFMRGQEDKMTSTYDYLEQHFDFSADINLAHITLAAALDWLEFRDMPSFRHYAQLTAWFEQFKQRQSMLATALPKV